MINQNDDKRSKVSDEKSNQVRAMIYPLAGVYMIYQAYCIYQEISATSEKHTLMLVFSIFFVIAGIGMTLLGFSISYKNCKRKTEQSEIEELDQNN